MPYIKEKDRLAISYLDDHDNRLINYGNINTPGELQYAMAVMFNEYVGRKGLNYQTLNDVMGAMSGADKEFYRLIVEPFEEIKMKINGGIY